MLHRRRHSGFPLLVFLILGLVLWAWAKDQGGQVVVFGGNNRRVAGEYNGGEATTVFGGYKLDLRDADPPQRPVTLTLRTVFGGADIRVPEDWNVVVENQAMFGAVEDRTRHPFRSQSAGELVVDGFTLFGGVKVQN
jgi:hypothetical protein